MRGLLAAIALALTLAASPAGCGPTGGNDKPAPTPPTPAVTPDPNAPVFRFRVTTISGRVQERKIALTVNSFGVDGRPGVLEHPITHQVVPSPLLLESIGTPLRWRIRPLPGVVNIEVAGYYLGEGGEFLECWVEQRGTRLPGSLNRKQIVPGRVSGRGSVDVSCEYLGI